MGFLQGIIADARPAASTAVADVNRAVTGRSERMTSPLSGDIASGKTGMQESDFGAFSGAGVADSGRGLSPPDRQSPAVSVPGVDTAHSSRHDSLTTPLTTENRAPVSGNDDQNRAALSVNVEYHGADLQERYPAETEPAVGGYAEPLAGGYVEPSANNIKPSANYREPSVFSVMPSEVHDAFQNDSLSSDTPLLSGHELSGHDQTHFNRAAHEKIASESLSHADGIDNPGTEPVSSPSAQPVRQEVSGPLIAGHRDHSDTPDKYALPGTRTGSVDASSVPLTRAPLVKAQLTGPDNTQEEKRHPLLSGNREAKQSGEPTSFDDLSQPTSGKTELSSSAALSRRSTLSDENKQRPFSHETTEVSAAQRSVAQPKATERKNSNNNTSPPEANRPQRQAAITTNSQRVAFQTEALVSSHIRQQPARKPDSPFIPPAPVQKAPEVKIGQVDVFIEAPRKETGSTRRTHKISQAFSSRHYLRRI